MLYSVDELITSAILYDSSYKISRQRKVLVLGSGGLTIGQAGEFDYSGAQVSDLYYNTLPEVVASLRIKASGVFTGTEGTQRRGHTNSSCQSECGNCTDVERLCRFHLFFANHQGICYWCEFITVFHRLRKRAKLRSLGCPSGNQERASNRHFMHIWRTDRFELCSGLVQGWRFRQIQRAGISRMQLSCTGVGLRL